MASDPDALQNDCTGSGDGAIPQAALFQQVQERRFAPKPGNHESGPLRDRVNADLACGLGNLASRTLTMARLFLDAGYRLGSLGGKTGTKYAVRVPEFVRALFRLAPVICSVWQASPLCSSSFQSEGAFLDSRIGSISAVMKSSANLHLLRLRSLFAPPLVLKANKKSYTVVRMIPLALTAGIRIPHKDYAKWTANAPRYHSSLRTNIHKRLRPSGVDEVQQRRRFRGEE